MLKKKDGERSEPLVRKVRKAVCWVGFRSPEEDVWEKCADKSSRVCSVKSLKALLTSVNPIVSTLLMANCQMQPVRV